MKDESAPALVIDRLTKKYRSGTLAVDELSLTVPKGEFFGLLGPNGAGKSSTIHCTTGIATITSGTIKVFGLNVEDDYREARKKIGLSPQEFNVDVFATPRQILAWMAGFFSIPPDIRDKRIEEILKRFELLPHADKKFMQLSGGLKRRVILARALVYDPDLLILDEPTAGVDVELRRELWQHLRELNEEGKTIILTSHYLEEVELLCSRIAIINKGKVAAIGNKDEFTGNGKNLEEFYLSITNRKEHAE
jgi:ABC-2 type transport system ATP-binding protein